MLRKPPRRTAEILERDVTELDCIIVHLGGGCSAVAVRGGSSVDTTMGLTPVDGMLMAERSGSIDPGLLLHVADRDREDPSELHRMLTRGAGLMGISDVSGDIGAVYEQAEQGHERACLARDAYVLAARRGIGQMLASLDRVDALVLTGSALEERPWLREAPVRALGVPCVSNSMQHAMMPVTRRFPHQDQRFACCSFRWTS